MPIWPLSMPLTTTLASSATSADAILLASLVAGVSLWLIGRRLVRPLYALLFAVLGGSCGFVAAPLTGLGFNPLITLAVGLVVGALIGLLLFRFSMALALAILLGAVSPAATLVFLHTTAPQENSADQPPLTGDDLFLQGVPIEGDDASAAIDGFQGTVSSLLDEAASDPTIAKVKASPLADDASRFIKAAFNEAWAQWGLMSTRDRLASVIASLTGVLAGFMLGFWKPRKVAAATTAFLGAAVWLPALTLLLAHRLPALGESLPRSTSTWLLIWLALSLAGTALQWTLLRPRADTKTR